MKIVIGNETFDTKSEARKHYTDRFLNHGIFKLTTDDKKTLYILASMNPDYTITIADFQLIVNKYNKIEIESTLVNGQTSGFSINNCIRGKGVTLLSKINKVFRDAVEPQILAFRNSSTQIPKCSLCKILSHDIQVDHVLPVFKTIISNFLIKNELAGNFDLTQEIIDGFTSYHQSVATYRFLCQKCNISSANQRGRKQLIPDDERRQYVREWHNKRYVRKKQSVDSSDNSTSE